MPAGFQTVTPQTSSGSKWWLWGGIVILLAVGSLGIYFAFVKDKVQSNSPSANAPTLPPANVPPVEPTPPAEPPAQPPAELDRARYFDVKNIQAALELYQADNKKYPLAPLPITLGLEASQSLSSAGWGTQTTGTVYLNPVPKNPTPGGKDYLYESLDGTTYTLSFRLDEGTAGLPSGDHQATPQGLDGVAAEPAPEPAPLVPRTVTPPTAGLDTDQDGLTDAEEVLFGSQADKPDSDSDGFPDGAEVKGGYDPAQTSGAKLEASALLAAYTSAKFNYKVRYPQAWLAKAVDEGESEVLFSGSEGEFIEVLVVDNPDGATAAAWYAKQVPGLKAGEVPTETINGLTWAWSLDGLNAYVATDKHLITLSYNIGTRTEASFYQLFRLMVKMFSFNVGSTPNQTPPGGTPGPVNGNLNTNSNTPVNEPG
jgi:hypothetical protein